MKKFGLLQWRFGGSPLPLFGYDREGDLWGKLTGDQTGQSSSPFNFMGPGCGRTELELGHVLCLGKEPVPASTHTTLVCIS